MINLVQKLFHVGKHYLAGCISVVVYIPHKYTVFDTENQIFQKNILTENILCMLILQANKFILSKIKMQK